MTAIRACGEECPWPDDQHIEPQVIWIGDCPIVHGERDLPLNDPEHDYCLCGHPLYLTCPGEGIWSMTIGDPYGGRLRGDENA